MTPNLLMPGRENQLPIEVVLGAVSTSGEAVTFYWEYIDDLWDHIQRACGVARKYLGKGAKRMKECYYVKQSLIQYQPGDLVMYGTEVSQLDVAPKLSELPRSLPSLS